MINRETINSAFLISATAIVVAAIVLAGNARSLVTAVFGSGSPKGDPAETIAQYIEKHEDALSTYQARFTGRSVFYLPPPPPPPPPPPRDRPTPQPQPREEPPPPPPPPPPSPPPIYRGPPVNIVMSDRAWFRGTRPNDPSILIRVGEEKEGIKLLSTDPPRSVRVLYDRGEFDVPIFDWTMVGLLANVGPAEAVPGLIRPTDLRPTDIIVPVQEPEHVPVPARGDVARGDAARGDEPQGEAAGDEDAPFEDDYVEDAEPYDDEPFDDEEPETDPDAAPEDEHAPDPYEDDEPEPQLDDDEGLDDDGDEPAEEPAEEGDEESDPQTEDAEQDP